MKTHWKAVLGILAVAIPALFNFLSAKASSDEAKIRAEVAYVTMQEAVKELQTAVHAHDLEIAELKGRVKAERRMRMETEAKLHPTYVPPTPIPAPAPPEAPEAADGDGIPDRPEAKGMSELPSFDKAVEEYKAKK